MSTEIEETITRLSSLKGVKGVLVMNINGAVIRSNFSNQDTENYSKLVSSLSIKATDVVKSSDEDDDLVFLRIRTKRYEIMVAPEKDYILVVVQDPTDNNSI